MKISFLTTSHFTYDERIFYHMAKTLADDKHLIDIVSSYDDENDIKEENENITVNSFIGEDLKKKGKVVEFLKRLLLFKPKIAICSEPLAVYAAFQYKKKYDQNLKIAYDITEWYPSKKQLSGLPLISYMLIFAKLILFNLYAMHITDAFIFGEYYKSIVAKKMFFKKPFLYLPYYSKKDYINPLPVKEDLQQLNLSYSGKISKEKGFENFISVIYLLKKKRPSLDIQIKIIGWPENDEYASIYQKSIEQLKKIARITQFSKMNLFDYINEIRDTDIFVDLRQDDFENQRCLPIRLFYFAAMKRPVIFSNLKAIKKEVRIDNFGFLVKPNDIEKTVSIIENYIDNKDLYNLHCKNARDLHQNIYNWDRKEAGFIDFLKMISL